MRLPWKYIVVSLVIGLLLGGASGLFYCRSFAYQWLRKSPEIFLKRLDHELKLSDQQKTQIHSLLISKRDKMEAFEEKDIRKTTRADIRATLTSDQQAGFDSMIAKHDAERRKREAQ